MAITADFIFLEPSQPLATNPLNKKINTVTEQFHRLDPEDYTMILIWTLRVTANKSLRTFPALHQDATAFTEQEFAQVKALALLLHGDLCRLDNVACEGWRAISRRVQSVLLLYAQQTNASVQFCLKSLDVVSGILRDGDYAGLPSCREFLLKIAETLKKD
jgi:hypothetical protein